MDRNLINFNKLSLKVCPATAKVAENLTVLNSTYRSRLIVRS